MGMVHKKKGQKADACGRQAYEHDQRRERRDEPVEQPQASRPVALKEAPLLPLLDDNAQGALRVPTQAMHLATQELREALLEATELAVQKSFATMEQLIQKDAALSSHLPNHLASGQGPKEQVCGSPGPLGLSLDPRLPCKPTLPNTEKDEVPCEEERTTSKSSRLEIPSPTSARTPTRFEAGGPRMEGTS
ncbi:unnamed protein product [Durusdinium trenchii]|uniref:Uncharacterized protein n=1 Tax=Durusdinium trenchii TaxID=1381693 RepID=A0ABP0M568_9DINO